MPIQDRDYYRNPTQPPPVIGRLGMWSVTTWLIAINVAVFVIDSIVSFATNHYPLAEVGYFSTTKAIYAGQVWRFLSFQFIHGDTWHLFVNMLAMYFFGPLIESYLASRRYLAYYLICGIAGAAAYLVLAATGILISDPRVPLVGASAGVFGILLGAARIAPNTRVMLLFPPIPIRLQTLAWIFVALAVLTILRKGDNAGGEAAHIGGAILGFVLIRNPRWLDVFDRLRRRRRY